MTAPSPVKSQVPSQVVEWLRSHLVWTLRACYVLAGVLVLVVLLAWKVPLLARIIVAMALARGLLLIPERLSEIEFLHRLHVGHFAAALETPGISSGRQIQLLRTRIVDRLNRPGAEKAADLAAYAIEAGHEEWVSLARAFEDTWGNAPRGGGDDGLVGRLLHRGFHFTTNTGTAIEPTVPLRQDIDWRDLWRGHRWQEVIQRHPGERLPTLLVRLYASEWQSVLAPAWFICAIILTVLLSTKWLGAQTRGLLFYVSGTVMGLSALWLAFVLRPWAFQASLLAGDMDRCAYWVLESTEGKHFLVACLGSRNERLRRQALRLLLWHDALLTANLTLPEGMKAFAHREGTSRRLYGIGRGARGDRARGAG